MPGRTRGPSPTEFCSRYFEYCKHIKIGQSCPMGRALYCLQKKHCKWKAPGRKGHPSRFSRSVRFGNFGPQNFTRSDRIGSDPSLKKCDLIGSVRKPDLKSQDRIGSVRCSDVIGSDLLGFLLCWNIYWKLSWLILRWLKVKWEHFLPFQC